MAGLRRNQWPASAGIRILIAADLPPTSKIQPNAVDEDLALLDSHATASHRPGMLRNGGPAWTGISGPASPESAAVYRNSLTKTPKTPQSPVSRSAIRHRPGTRELLARHQVKRRPDMREIRKQGRSHFGERPQRRPGLREIQTKVQSYTVRRPETGRDPGAFSPNHASRARAQIAST